MSEDIKTENIEKKSIHKRYDWLDQFRGIVVLLLIISVITWPLSGDFSTGELIVGPTFLNHGYKYYNGNPAIITIIDIGQQIFMFVMGFVAYIAFSSRLEKKGTKEAWKHGLIRVGILYFLSFLDDGLIGGLIINGEIPWNDVIYNGTLANLAIGSLAAMIGTFLFRDADKRIYVGIGIMILHSILFALPYFDHYGPSVGDIEFPFNSLNHAAIAIIGTCFSQWIKMDPDDPTVGFKKRILPAATLTFITCYCIDWIQSAEHHDVTSSLALMAIGTGGFMLAIFYGFEQMNFKIPVLSEFGKNMLLMFILSFLVADLYVQLFPRDFLVTYPYFAVILVGIVPIAVEAVIAVVLDKKNIIIKI